MAKQDAKAFFEDNADDIALKIGLELERNPEWTVASMAMSEGQDKDGKHWLTAIVVFNIDEIAEPSFG
ncbi:hypothetical protein ACIOD2_27335 [Amycolatopsis sp. NPDC088138]|uniref:hypothetical protein n=1 Tax=Amycolatopsis sp. NPDC088138 TaxID=3363938 RepID=UPI003800C645